MYISSNLSSNKIGNLTIAGVDTVELAHKYGTPLYVFDEEVIRASLQTFKKSIDNYYSGAGMVCYASKAFCCKEICRIVKDENCGIDVVSMGELYTAMSVNFPAEKICYHGNNKTAEELTLALDYGVGRIVVDNIDELVLLNSLACEQKKTVKILLRLTPGIEAHTHSFIMTGQIDSKFGFTIQFGTAMKAVELAISLSNIELDGIHCHIGSQIFDIEPFVRAAEILSDFIFEAKEQTGAQIKTMNLGGGFGIGYVHDDDPVAYDEYMKQVSAVVGHKFSEHNMALPFIIIEPGRSIVAQSGITLYTVGNVKTIETARTYVAVDGGMTDNIRYALYGSHYDFIIANRVAEEKTTSVTIAGRCCESGDLLGENVPLQKAESGDILAACCTGAYNYSMANNYNRVRKPAAVIVKAGVARTIIRRETLEDMLMCDL